MENFSITPNIKDSFLTRHSQNFNDETIAAMKETRAIAEGKIESKSFHSVEELMKDLLSDVDD